MTNLNTSLDHMMSVNGTERKRKVSEHSTSCSEAKKVAQFQPHKRLSKIVEASASKSDSDNDEDEKCPICLKGLTSQPLSITDTCSHHTFCLSCLEEWSKTRKTCPVDRKEYKSILVLDSGGKVMKQLPVRSVAINSFGSWPPTYEPTFCELCGLFTNEDLMLICDGCGMGYHLYCLTPPMETMPSGIWLCNDCWYYYNY